VFTLAFNLRYSLHISIFIIYPKLVTVVSTDDPLSSNYNGFVNLGLQQQLGVEQKCAVNLLSSSIACDYDKSQYIQANSIFK
jgi:hypothetical protein